MYHTRKAGNNCALLQAGEKANGDQRLYGDTDAILIGFSTFQTTSGTPAAVPASITYKASATSDVPENISNFFGLISALTGVTASSGNAPPPSADKFVAAGSVSGYRKAGRSKLPFFFNLSYSVAFPTPASNQVAQSPVNGAGGPGGGGPGGNGPGGSAGTKSVAGNGAQSPSGQQVTDCTTLSPSNSPCSSSKTLRSDDPEIFDVSIGIAVPGVPELTYGTDLTAKPKTTWHSDFYAFADIYPFGKLVSKESPVPHLLFGVPITSKPLHR